MMEFISREYIRLLDSGILRSVRSGLTSIEYVQTSTSTFVLFSIYQTTSTYLSWGLAFSPVWRFSAGIDGWSVVWVDTYGRTS